MPPNQLNTNTNNLNNSFSNTNNNFMSKNINDKGTFGAGLGIGADLT